MEGFAAGSGSRKYGNNEQFANNKEGDYPDDSVVLKRPRRNFSKNNLFDNLTDFEVSEDVSQPNNISPAIDYYHCGGRLRPNERAFDSLVLENTEDHDAFRRPRVESDCSGSAQSVNSAASSVSSGSSLSDGQPARSIKSYLRGYGWFVPMDR